MRVLFLALLLAISLASSAANAAEVRERKSTATTAEQSRGILNARETVLAASAGQDAFDPLPSSEEFGIGGPEFLRAFEPSEQVGDHGLAGRLELPYLVDVGQPFLEAAQIDRFGDVGRIWNREAAPEEVERMSLASVGGVRFNMTEWLSGVVEVAVPLKGEVAAEELNEDGSGDDVRVFGALATTF